MIYFWFSLMKQGKSILKFKFMVKCKVWSLQYKKQYVDNFNLFCWSISTFLQHDKAILTKKSVFWVKHLSGAIFSGVRSPLLGGSQLRFGVRSNIRQIQRFGAINCGVHGRRALPPSVNEVNSIQRCMWRTVLVSELTFCTSN